MNPVMTLCGMLPAAALLSLSTAAIGDDRLAAPELTEWQVPWPDTRPRDPWFESDERVWFVGQRADYVATLNPETGEFRRFDLIEGAGPHTVIANNHGAWYAGNRAAHIGRIHAHDEGDDHQIEVIELPGEGRRDVHTMAFTSNGDIWFTVQGGNQVGLLRVANRDITLLEVASEQARPYGLIVDADDHPWFTLFGTNRLGSVNPETMDVVEIELPRAGNRPRRLDVTGDGMIWYVDYAEGYLGRYNPENGEIDEWRTPAGEDSRPYAMAVDAKDRVWLVETGVSPNRFVGFDPATQTFGEAAEPDSGGGTIRHMHYDPDGHAIWFGTDTNTIGRARLP